MTLPAPRIEINLEKIKYNAQFLVSKLKVKNISVTGVVKSVMGNPIIISTLNKAGVETIGYIQLNNLKKNSHVNTKKAYLIRTPMLSQAKAIVLSKVISFNSEYLVIKELSNFAKELNLIHEIILMIELGDLREGIMPNDIYTFVEKVIELPNIHIKGIGTNLSCLNGVCPDISNMKLLTKVAENIENLFGISLEVISGGNSSTLNWIFNDGYIGRINNLRLGESIFLGIDPLYNKPIKGLYTNAITLIAEVIESKQKPSRPIGNLGIPTYNKINSSNEDEDFHYRTILAIGHQDIDPYTIKPNNLYEIIGASSDQTIINTKQDRLDIGSELSFIPDYKALLKASISPYVHKIFI